MSDQPERDCTPESELSKLGNEQLLEFIVAERDAGRPECAKKALGVLAFGYWGLVRALVSAKVPPQDVDDVAATVMEAALKSAFDGTSVGEFVNWLKMIARRRGVADFHRSRESTPTVDPLVEEHEGDETIFGEVASVDGEAEAIHVREAAARVLENRNPLHQLVIRLYGPNELNYMGLDARETAARVEAANPGQTMSEANVHQIWRRYRTDLHDELGLRGS